MWRPYLFIFAILAVAGACITFLNPVNSTILRLALLGFAGGAWTAFLILAWNRKAIRIVLLIIPVLLGIPFVLPGRVIDEDEVRVGYLKRMSELEGTEYFWGGESSRGIDCSGLPRRALRDALLAHGMRRANGAAFRAYLEHWWFDASAKALGEGYRDYTRPVGVSGTIREMDYRDLKAGDLAVTTNGVHVLAYAGEGRWIQADPGLGHVATLDGRKDQNSWFRVPVTTHRWRFLAGP